MTGKRLIRSFAVPTIVLLAVGCGGESGPTGPRPPEVDISGPWSGSMESSRLSQASAELILSQNGAQVTGTWATASGFGGTLTGDVSGSDVTLTFAQDTAECSGTFNATAQVNGPATSTAASTMTVAYTGSDCNGAHTGGAGTFTRPDPANNVYGVAIDTRFTDSGKVSSPRDLTGVLEVLVESGATFTSFSAVGGPLGTFRVPGVTADTFYLKLGDTYVVTSNRDLDLGLADFGRAFVQTAPENTTMNFNASGMSPWQSGDDLLMISLNAGVFESLVPSFNSPISNGDTVVQSLQVRWEGLPLIDSSQGDQASVLQFTARQSDSGVSYSAAAKVLTAPAFTMQSGGLTTVQGGQFLDVPQDLNVLYQWSRSKFTSFTTGINPQAVLAAQYLLVLALPEASKHGLFSTDSYIAFADTGVAATDLSTGIINFGNPYPQSWELAASAQTLYLVGYTLPGARFPARLVGGITRSGEAAAMASAPIEPVVGPVQNPTVNGASAFTEAVGIGASPELAWQPPASGQATFYTVSVDRLFLVGNSFPTSATVATIHTAGTRVRIPPNILQQNERYVFTITARHAPGLDFARRPFVRSLSTGTADTLSGMMIP